MASRCWMLVAYPRFRGRRDSIHLWSAIAWLESSAHEARCDMCCRMTFGLVHQAFVCYLGARTESRRGNVIIISCPFTLCNMYFGAVKAASKVMIPSTGQGVKT